MLILLLLVVVAVLTWIIPGGEYQRISSDGREIVDPQSFQHVASNPVWPQDVFVTIVRGFNDSVAVRIIMFILIVSGSFSVIQSTGAFEKSIRRLAWFFTRRPQFKLWLIPVFMFFFAFMGSTFGMSEEVIVFIPLFVPLAIALGYDSITGVAIPFMGARIGFAGAFMNPFTVGISQELSGLALFSGWELRVVLWFALTLAGCAMVMVYARTIALNPEKSPVFAIDREREQTWNATTEPGSLSLRDAIIMGVFALSIVFIMYGVQQWGWFIEELTAVFLALGIISAILGKLDGDEAVKAFLKGMKNVMLAVVVVALSRAVLLLMDSAYITDSVLYYLSGALAGLPAFISAQLMLVVQIIINVIVPSGSGQAALTIPILAPLGDLIGLTRQTVVLIFQLGDGLSNLIIPTAAVTMAVLGMAEIPWQTWARWMIGRLAILYGIGALFVLFAVLTGYA